MYALRVVDRQLVDTRADLGTAAERVTEGVLVTGGLEPADERISWAVTSPGARVPINSYLLVEGSDCAIVDTGVPAHEEILLAALQALAPAMLRAKLVITRGVELESMGNTTVLLRTQPIEGVWAHFPSPSWFRIDPRFDLDDDGALREAATPFHPLRPGETIPIDPDGERALEVLEPALRLLQTAWLYDAATGTLFTSDAFGHALVGPGASSRILDESSDDVSLADVEAGLEPKFGWLREADVRPTCAALAGVFDRIDVQTICPTVGSVLRGPRLVRRHVDMVLRVLEKWGADGV